MIRRTVVPISRFAAASALLFMVCAGAQSAPKLVNGNGATLHSAAVGQTTTTALTVVSETTEKGSDVTLFATVHGSEGTPSGVVTFWGAGKSLGEAPLVRGAAHLTVSSLPAGTTALIAQYKGNQTLLPSKSSTVNVFVGAETAQAASAVALTRGVTVP